MVPNLNSTDVTWAINFLEQNATEYCMTRGLIQDIARKANDGFTLGNAIFHWDFVNMSVYLPKLCRKS